MRIKPWIGRRILLVKCRSALVQPVVDQAINLVRILPALVIAVQGAAGSLASCAFQACMRCVSKATGSRYGANRRSHRRSYPAAPVRSTTADRRRHTDPWPPGHAAAPAYWPVDGSMPPPARAGPRERSTALRARYADAPSAPALGRESGGCPIPPQRSRRIGGRRLDHAQRQQVQAGDASGEAVDGDHAAHAGRKGLGPVAQAQLASDA